MDGKIPVDPTRPTFLILVRTRDFTVDWFYTLLIPKSKMQWKGQRRRQPETLAMLALWHKKRQMTFFVRKENSWIIRKSKKN